MNAKISISILLHGFLVLQMVYVSCAKTTRTPKLVAKCNSNKKCLEYFKEKLLAEITPTSLYIILEHKNSSFTLQEFKNVMKTEKPIFTNLSFEKNEKRDVKIEEIGANKDFITNVVRSESGAWNVETYTTDEGVNTCSNGNHFSCPLSSFNEKDYVFYKTALDTSNFDSYFRAGITTFIGKDLKEYSLVYPSKPCYGGDLIEAYPWKLNDTKVYNPRLYSSDYLTLFNRVENGIKDCDEDEVLAVVIRAGYYCEWQRRLRIGRKLPQLHVFYNPSTGLGSDVPLTENNRVANIQHMTFGYRYKDMNGVEEVRNAFVLYPDTEKSTTTTNTPKTTAKALTFETISENIL